METNQIQLQKDVVRDNLTGIFKRILILDRRVRKFETLDIDAYMPKENPQ